MQHHNACFIVQSKAVIKRGGDVFCDLVAKTLQLWRVKLNMPACSSEAANHVSVLGTEPFLEQ